MNRSNQIIIRKIELSILIAIFGIAGILPVWALINRVNSDEYWSTIFPELVQMDSSVLDRMIRDVENNNYGVYSIFIVKNGYLVKEWYQSSFDKDYLFRVFSVSKSVTSALIGIALDKGFINSLDEFVLDYFPDYDIANPSPEKDAMTIWHLLTMTTGLYWPEYYPYSDPRNPYNDWKASEDHVGFVLNRTMDAAPGSIFNYNTGASHLLSAILQRATNMSTLDFANQYLFGPLSIEESLWVEDPQGVAGGGDNLYLSPRNMAKIGYLYFKGGMWEDKQIVSEEWVRTSTSNLIDFGGVLDYGYQWWIAPDGDFFRALGYGGQQINVFPSDDLIIVFTGMNINFDFASYLIYTYIFPSIF
ncbi:MAG: serine hydrolase domain-containing protein [Candidatus Hermodarchaeota archaeon]